MIAAGDPQDFVPYGRHHLQQHPKNLSATSPQPPQSASRSDLGLQLLTALRDVSLKDKLQTTKENWLVRAVPQSDDITYDEELYICGYSVIWSKGNSSHNRCICKSYTLDYPIQQALWCDIYLAKNKPSILAQSSSNEDEGTVEPSICVVDTINLNFFTTKGQEYVIPLPFQIVSAWPIKYGILLERTIMSHELNSTKREAEHLSTLFSLMHPLDDITPVIKTSGGVFPVVKASYLKDQNIQVVFTCSNPSLVMFYNNTLGVHTVWKIRKAKSEELQSLSTNSSDVGSYSQQCTPSSNMTPNASSSQSRLLTSSRSPTQLSISPMRSFGNRVNSPSHSSRPQSPSLSGITHMAALSRSQSPSASGSNSYQRYPYNTPSPAARSPVTTHKSFLAPPDESLSIDTSMELVEPLTPDLCLDLIWMENAGLTKCSEDGKAKKAFITVDFVEQQFLCYVVPAYNQIRCIKFEESNDQSQLIFGVTTSISGRDAVPVDKCNMMLVLDVSYSLILYTGVIKVCKVYIPSGPMLLRSSTASHVPASHVPTATSSRRCSLVTSSRPPSAMDAHFDDEVQLLSPVPSDHNDSSLLESSFSEEPSSSVAIIKLRDPVYNRVTIEFANGIIQRITIPKVVESSLVEASLQAVRSVLPRDLAVQLYTKWYATVNMLGNSRNNRSHEWSTFVACLLAMMGYNLEHLTVTKQLEIDLSLSPAMLTKKFKFGDNGTEEDWQYLLGSQHHEQNAAALEEFLGFSSASVLTNKSATSGTVNTGAVLFPYIPALLYVLHLVYEELKLKVFAWRDLESMVPLLMHLARDLRIMTFLDYYWRDFPELYVPDEQSQVDENTLATMIYPTFLSSEPPSVFQWTHTCLLEQSTQPFPYISQVNPITKTVVTLYAAMVHGNKFHTIPAEKYLKKITATGYRRLSFPTDEINVNFNITLENTVHEMLLACMTKIGLTLKDIENLPIGVALPLRNAIFQCRRNPPSYWSEETYCLIGRQDLSAHMKVAQKMQPVKRVTNKTAPDKTKKSILTKDDDDGMENLDHEVLKLRFSNDQRIQEVRRLLQSSKPVRIYITQRPEVNDHDFVEEQERYLYGLCMRTMALPVGRGMFTLHTSQPVSTEMLPIPKLCLTGRAPPRNTTVDLSHIDPPANMNVWPLFHNGVAAGLRITPKASQIDSTWIVYNKPKGSNEMPMEHAGFLMSLGLNGHLNNLAIMNVHDYLCKGHEMTSVGLILGIAAAKRGTMDVATTKLLSIHVEALLPPTSTELDVSHVVQVAAILGVGLVYEGTAHRHMSEILLSEIGRPPGPEMENSSDRESYSLAAGLALGLVTFGSGNEVAGLLDLSMADQLYHFMVGGHKRPLLGVHKEKYKSPSYQIKEGDSVNIDVTSPGATLALGMMYFRTGNKAVAEWMAAPDTQFLLDFVRPDFLLLRTFSSGLILWDDIHPSSEWVEKHIPALVSANSFKMRRTDEAVDYETMNQAFCNILAGACMALGFRFAGSANDAAYNTLMKYVKLFINFLGKQAAEQTGRSTIDNCLNVVLLSLAMVMVGTGDLEVLRICRYLHFRVGQNNNLILYGSHMATHMALGLLFLGGGKYTLSTRPSAVAAMICAFYPKFPIHSSDNRYHLQAFRHLYVLAVEPRLVVPRDIETGLACYTNLNIKFKDSPWYKDVQFNIRAPCFLPELDLLQEVSVEDSRYWPIKFDHDKNWNSLKCLLENHGMLYVKQKAGCLSYVEDPRGFRSLLSQSLTKDNSGNWSVKPEAIEAFSCDATILNFANFFLEQDPANHQEAELKQLLCGIVYECVTQEKMEIFVTCVTLLQFLKQSSTSTIGLWQLKLALTFANMNAKVELFRVSSIERLLNPEFALALQSHLERRLHQWQQDNSGIVTSYIGGQLTSEAAQLVKFLVYYDVPMAQKFGSTFTRVLNTNLGSFALQLKDHNLNTATLMDLIQ